ncbi:MAG: hypothetical protein JWN98_65, partial [Abditibacteriota bacterium]|nr:hypothetical protein [Abditibacteriota bacterium]
YGRTDDGYGTYDSSAYPESAPDYDYRGGEYRGSEDAYARYPDYGANSLKARNAKAANTKSLNAQAKTKVAKRNYAVK